MISIPNLVDNAWLEANASDSDEWAQRLVLRSVVNNADYKVSGRTRKYVFRHDPELGAHVLDVPASLYMAGMPTGRLVENGSIAYDLHSNRWIRFSPIIPLMIPWKKPAATVPAPDKPAAETVKAPDAEAAKAAKKQAMRERMLHARRFRNPANLAKTEEAAT